VDALRSFSNGSATLFNDLEIKGVSPYKGHDNHLQVKVKQDE